MRINQPVPVQIVSLGKAKINVLCENYESIPKLEVLKNDTSLKFLLKGNSPDQAEGQFILESEPSAILSGKKLHVQSTFKEVLHADCRSVVENYRIFESENGPIIQVIMRSKSANGWEQSIDGSLNIEVFAELVGQNLLR